MIMCTCTQWTLTHRKDDPSDDDYVRMSLKDKRILTYNLCAGDED